ncbi:DUF2306 domain-containing protein [Nocardiopsis sp. NPDC058631]|uniref:DUF2306 domain-containing protein n=1 Tax=Nocardiopsis sp. NPDC058631 TaxID=3346566 RepID=UPI00365EAB3B
MTTTVKPPARAGWTVPALLILLSVVPLVAGAFRVGELASGAPVTADNARFFAAPLPVVLHILAASPYCVLGALQFSPGLRRRRPRWHRASGRLLVLLGLATALTGLWMTLFYSIPAIDTGFVTVQRLVFGSAMAVALVLGFVAARRREIARHRAWMIRAYAIGQGAGTQVLTHLPWMILVGEYTELSRALLMGAGWVINLAVAEWFIRRGQRPRSVQRAREHSPG